jgi:hypothetical protein
MPEQKNLELLRPLRAAQQYDQLKQSAQAQIDERPNHARPPKLGRREATDLRAEAAPRGTTRVSEPHALQTLHISVSAGNLPSVRGAGILLLAFALAGILTRAFPRWLAWSALVLGILQLTPTPGLIGFFAGLALLPWTFAAGIAMFMRPGYPTSATAHGGSATPYPASALTNS